MQLWLDDFGTGYSSLSYLQNFPVDIVKVDRSFIAKLSNGRATRSIVRAFIDLSHELDLSVVAEGVETQQDLQEITKLRADYAQGYHISGPISKPELYHFASRLPTSEPLLPSRVQ